MDQNQPPDRMPLSLPGVPQEVVDGINQGLKDLRDGKSVGSDVVSRELRSVLDATLAKEGLPPYDGQGGFLHEP